MKKIVPTAALVIAIIVAVIWWHSSANAPQGQNLEGLTSQTTQQQAAQKVSHSTSTASFNKNQYSLTDPTSLWVVVNKDRPLNPIDYAPSDLVSVGNGQQMRAAAASAFKQMQSAASVQGLSIYAASGYRSYQTQEAAYGSMVKAYGQAYADSLSARPGYSEHQTGWAVDIGTGSCSLSNCFATTPSGKWVAANAYKYGFLMRYPQDYQNITGYDFESWHFRYIGIALATELHNTGIKTLEQFFGLPDAPNYQ